MAEQDLHRLTLTAAFINRARAVAFLVAGAAKAAVVREVLQGPRDPRRLPAQLIHPEPGELHWFLDQAAAGALRPGRISAARLTQVNRLTPLFFNQAPKTANL